MLRFHSLFNHGSYKSGRTYGIALYKLGNIEYCMTYYFIPLATIFVIVSPVTISKSFHCDQILMEATSERDGLYLLVPDSKLEFDPKGVEITGLPSASSTCHLPPSE